MECGSNNNLTGAEGSPPAEDTGVFQGCFLRCSSLFFHGPTRYSSSRKRRHSYACDATRVSRVSDVSSITVSVMATVISPTDRRVIIKSVSWETYERLLADFGDSTQLARIAPVSERSRGSSRR